MMLRAMQELNDHRAEQISGTANYTSSCNCKTLLCQLHYQMELDQIGIFVLADQPCQECL
jgi:hypothetical protein